MENSVDSISHSQVVIIGAGPAGLCLGYHLKKQGISFTIVEQNEVVGSSWRKMPDHLHLITLWKSNNLIPEDKTLFHPYKKHTANEFAAYLEAFSKKHALNIIFNCKVDQITQENDGVVLETSKGKITSKIVVDCRGYFNFPFTPVYPISGQPPLMLHFKDYKNRTQLKDYKNILIVGKRLSAGQLIAELTVAHNHKIFLSIRSHLHFGPPPAFLNHFLKNLNIYEAITKYFSDKIKREIEVPMDHAVKKIIDREVTVVRDIQKIEDKKVTFVDGRAEVFDAIIFATGFHPPSVQLKNDFESTEIKNLFYLGRNSQRTFTSRFIRGIRDDAEILGKLIRGSLESSNKSQ
jgi:putative flavoprotein involved in K+ transport